MWSTEHSAGADVDPQAVWRLWADVAGWARWNADIEAIELHGPFAVGSTITATPRGAPTVQLRIAEAAPGESFVDEADLGGTVIRTTHRVERLDGGRARVSYRLEATGPDEEQLGPAISADFGETIAALLRHAAG